MSWGTTIVLTLALVGAICGVLFVIGLVSTVIEKLFGGE